MAYETTAPAACPCKLSISLTATAGLAGLRPARMIANVVDTVQLLQRARGLSIRNMVMPAALRRVCADVILIISLRRRTDSRHSPRGVSRRRGEHELL